MALMVGLGLLVPVAGFLGLMTSMASDGCTVSTCNSTVIGLGMAVSASSTLVFFLVSLVWVIVRWVRGRTTWWVPLVALVAAAVLWVVGLVITASGVG